MKTLFKDLPLLILGLFLCGCKDQSQTVEPKTVEPEMSSPYKIEILDRTSTWSGGVMVIRVNTNVIVIVSKGESIALSKIE